MGRASFQAQFYGRVEWLDEQGAVREAWRIDSQKCTIGSDSRSTIRIEGLKAIELSIAFGRRHTLLKSHQSGFITNNRQVREWLIDEPTTIEVGGYKLAIVPGAFTQELPDASQNQPIGSGPTPNPAEQPSSPAHLPNAEGDSTQTTLVPSNDQIRNIIIESTATAISKSLEPLFSTLHSLTARWENEATKNVTSSTAEIEERFEQIERQIPLLSSEVEQLNSKFTEVIQQTDVSMHNMADDIRGQFEQIAARLDQSVSSRESNIETTLAALHQQLMSLQSRLVAPHESIESNGAIDSCRTIYTDEE